MALPEAHQILATRRYQARLEDLSLAASIGLMVAFASLEDYDEPAVAELERRAAPLANGVKTAAVSLTLAFLAFIAELAAPRARPEVVPVEMDWRSPFIAVWRALGSGRPWEEAVEAGMARSEAEATNLVVASSRLAGDQVPEAGIVGWRRVLTSPSCDWCRLVSTQRYRSAESANFGHAHCDCTVVPIFGTADPGRVINRQLLNELRQEGAVDRISAQKTMQRANRLRQSLDGLPPAQREKVAARVAAYERRAAQYRSLAASKSIA